MISLSDAVTDIQGNRLDGEWVNPMSLTTTNSLVSYFPSGNDDAGGDFNFVFTLMSGDMDRDLVVGQTDLDLLMNYFGDGLSNHSFTEGDFTGDGIVDDPDGYAWELNMGADFQSLFLLADLNGDFAVDGLDVEILDENVGMANPTQADGDLDSDGDIDEQDVDLMFAQYGLELAVVS